MIGNMSVDGSYREMKKVVKKMVGCELDRQGVCKQSAGELAEQIADAIMEKRTRNWNDPDFTKAIEEFKRTNKIPEVGFADTMKEILRGRVGREKNKALVRFVSERLWRWITSKTDQPYKEAYNEMYGGGNSAAGVRG